MLDIPAIRNSYSITAWVNEIRQVEQEAARVALEDVARKVEGLRDRAQRQGTWGIEYGDDRLLNDVLALLRSKPVGEDLEG